MYKNVLLIVFCAFLLQSCLFDTSQDHKISPKAYEAIPYNGDEILIFKSDSNKLDSISIKGTTSAMVRGGDPFSIHPDRNEHIRLDYTHALGTEKNGLLYLSMFGDELLRRFEFNLGHSRLFTNTPYYTSVYDTIPTRELRVMDSLYTDVKTIHTDPYYEDRPERILNFYWSESSGLLGWDTPTDVWRLVQVK